MTGPFFSVVIPTYNRAALLQQALASVMAQTYPDFEVIVVDDGSTESMGDVAHWGERVRWFRQENKGAGAARNLGARHARGTFLAFLDSDDLWLPWTLATHRQAIESFPGSGWCAGMAVEFSGDRPPAVPQAEIGLRRYGDYLESAGQPPWILPGAVTIRRDVFLGTRGFAENIRNAEDSDLWLKLGVTPGFIRIEEPTVLAYRRHANSAVGNWRDTALGTLWLIESERSQTYPGGRSRREARRALLSEHVRPAALQLARRGYLGLAWPVYWRTFSWHVHTLRLRYLLGFWAYAAAGLLRPGKVVFGSMGTPVTSVRS